MSHSAEVYNNDGNHWLTPIRPTIKSLQEYLQRMFTLRGMCDEKDVKEIVVLKGSMRKMPKIHGYYDWVNGKLRLDKSKPAFIHNILYGLGD